MGASRLLKTALSSSGPALPITVAEFATALSRIWSSGRPRPIARTRALSIPIGLAISGGVDSMALAVLCNQFALEYSRIAFSPDNQQDSPLEPLPRLQFNAFVVDHGVRRGSDVEAQNVAGLLKSQLSIPTTVLKIAWPLSLDPHEASDFESQARKHRFQLLGTACRDKSINSLLLAHHQDDQVETIFARMIEGHRGMGLIGIREKSEIPECHGIFGVHESGEKHLLREQFPREKTQLQIEGGGVKVYRPLLNFSKARLIATCQSSKMPWFEDPTNSDPTFTTRNAIRYLYSHQVPASLSKSRLLSLSKTIQGKSELRQEIAEILLKKCHISEFSTMTGSLKIRFVDISVCQSREPQSLQSQDYDQIAAELLRRVISLISPEKNVSLSTLHGTVRRIFPELSPPNHRPNHSKQTAFTVAGVYFQPITVSNIPGEKCQYLISRQPLTLSKIRDLTIPISSTSLSPWHLYDSRFWIRLHPHNPNLKIYLTLFQPHHVSHFKASLSPAMLKRLNELAPGKIRFTLPAIVMNRGDGERVLALPSLGIGVCGTEKVVEWECRYKKLDLDELILGER